MIIHKSPNQMAQELIDKFSYSCYECNYEENAINSALTMVNQIISMSDKNKIVYQSFEYDTITSYTELYYWHKVKEQLERIQGGNK